jgi:HTH-type transcriptional regulator/antitoxin HigA
MPMQPRLIATQADYETALSEIRRLWDAEPGSPRAEKLELLAMLAHRYERDREPLPTADPIEAIKFRMDQQGLTRRDLAPIFGTTGRLSEVMSGKRALSLEMIRKLHFRLGIPLESLIPEKPLRSRRRTLARKPRIRAA